MSAYYFMKEEQWEKEKTYNLTDNQFLILKQIEYKEARRKAESILRFIKKGVMLNNGLWNISFSEFHKLYNNWVNKRKKNKPTLKNISLTQLKFTVNRLRDLGLLIIEKNKKTNIYKLAPTQLATKKPTNEENSESIENTNVNEKKIEKSTPMLQCLNNIDIDSYSNSQNFDSSKYKKCTSFIDVRRRVRELLDKARVKSSFIRDSIMNSISNNYKNITEKFLDNYILKAIENARLKAIKTWNDLNKKKYGVQANFTQRDYNWNVLEEALLSHY